MTGFHLAQNLLAYSGGTVRALHPVIYSLVALLPQPQALKRNIYFLSIAHENHSDVNQKVDFIFNLYTHNTARIKLQLLQSYMQHFPFTFAILPYIMTS